LPFYDFASACTLRCSCPRGVDLISDVLPFGRLWYGGTNAVANAIGYAEHFSRSHDAVIRVYDETGNVIVAAIFRSEMECGAALVAIFKGAT